MSVANIQEVHIPMLEEKKVRLFILREDQRHTCISGNKWWKLKYNLAAARRQGCQTLLTFGGAYSNHIYATAAAGKEFGFQTIGIIRGEAHVPLNSTLTFATQQGMRLRYLDRTSYQHKEDEAVLSKLRHKFGEFYLIPEGGTNTLAVQGCDEMVKELPDFDVVGCSCGTGGTLAGIAAGLPDHTSILGFSALKNGEFLKEEINGLTRQYHNQIHTNFSIITDYHFGGYAKANAALIHFMNEFRTQTGIVLDPVYTGKMLYGLTDLIKKDFFEENTSVLAIHTGGLQGIAGFNERHKNKKLPILAN